MRVVFGMTQEIANNVYAVSKQGILTTLNFMLYTSFLFSMREIVYCDIYLFTVYGCIVIEPEKNTHITIVSLQYLNGILLSTGIILIIKIYHPNIHRKFCISAVIIMLYKE